MFWELIALLVIAATFAFLLTNGLHDASSVVATFIACGAGTPVQAVLLAAVMGLAGAVTGGSAVAYTMVKLIKIAAGYQLLLVLLAGLLAASLWNVLTWQLGLPSSSTHALVGGLMGAVWVASGSGAIVWGWEELIGSSHQITGVMKIVIGLVISPLLGFCVAFAMQKITSIALRNASFAVNKWIKKSQWILAGLMAFNYGANDTQKSMGVIVLVLVSIGWNGGSLEIPLWVRLCAGTILFMGTMFGGWSIMKTLGRGIFTLRPLHSLNSQFSAGGGLALATFLGAPVSTTHLVVGTVVGVGAADEYRMVNWKVGMEMVIAWFVTIPAAALSAVIIYYPLYWIVLNIAGEFH